MNKNKKVIYFISVIRPLYKNVTSTYIMTSSLLKGLKENNAYVVFFAICEHKEEMQEVKEYFSNYADTVIPLPSAFGYNLSKYSQLSKLIFRSAFIGFYDKAIKKYMVEFIIEPDLIISHSPSFESICYSRILKKKYKDVEYYQYWSDPMALSGITPDKIDFKRSPFRFVESNAIKYADKIVYGTKTLMSFQKKLYHKHSQKMFYIDIPYVEKEDSSQEILSCSILYAGNYHKNIRNIEPLIEAVESMEGYRLDIYGDGEIKDRPLHNTHVHGRISSEELSGIEGKYEYLVCVLNHSCIQIPGKIFYDMARKVKIIVLADGKYKEELCSYLRQYDRFVVCNNTSSEIKERIISASSSEVDYEIIKKKFSPKKICSDLLNGGYK